jgi:hypothetical protein
MTTLYCSHKLHAFTLKQRGGVFMIRVNHKLNRGPSIHVATGDLLLITNKVGKPIFFLKVAGFQPKIYYGKYITSGLIVPEWISDY